MAQRIHLTILLIISLLLAACNSGVDSGGSSEPTRGDAVVFVAVPLSGFQANGGQTIDCNDVIAISEVKIVTPAADPHAHIPGSHVGTDAHNATTH